jgi:predicted HicB family RNase H-like nuclease
MKKILNFRVGDKLHSRLKSESEERDVSMSTIIKDALRLYFEHKNGTVKKGV